MVTFVFEITYSISYIVAKFLSNGSLEKEGCVQGVLVKKIKLVIDEV
jgi:hypothetical protein